MNGVDGMTSNLNDDEYEVHGAFILTDLLEDTSAVSSQVVIG